jgi:hypothetical protein
MQSANGKVLAESLAFLALFVACWLYLSMCMDTSSKTLQKSFIITCQKLDGEEIVVTLSPGATTVAHVKLGVESLCGLKCDHQQLYKLDGKDALEDEATFNGPCVLVLCVTDKSASAVEEENGLCRQMQEIEGGSLPQMIVATAMQAGGECGRELMLAMLRPKLEPHLARLELNWGAIQDALEAIESSEVLFEAFNGHAGDFVLKLMLAEDAIPKITRLFKLQEEDRRKISNIVSNMSVDMTEGMSVDTNEGRKERKRERRGSQPLEQFQRDALFAALMPLVHSEPAVATAEALLVALLRLDKGLGDEMMRFENGDDHREHDEVLQQRVAQMIRQQATI